MFTVRVVRATDPSKPAMSRDHVIPTKKEALYFIGTHGKLSSIRRLGKLYIIVPSK